MQDFLKLRGTTFWFRRKVPKRLALRLDIREFACSLRTGSRRDADARAKAVWLETEKVFALATSSLAREQAMVLLRRIAQEQPWAPSADVAEVGRRAAAGDERDVLAILEHTRTDVLLLGPEEQGRVLLFLREWLDLLEVHGRKVTEEALARAPGTVGPMTGLVEQVKVMNRQRHHLALVRDLGKQVETRVTKPEPTVATFVDALVADRTSPGLGKKAWTAGTAYQNRTTYRLWTELMGDVPVVKVTGREAGLFRERLLRLPASHGKAVGKGGKRPQISAEQAIEAADARDGVTRAIAEAAGKPPIGLVPRLSLKTAARHFSAMTQMWKWLRAREHVSSLPFTGFEFPRVRSARAARDDWSETDLLRLLRSHHMRAAAAARGRDWWLVVIAMYTGMRLEEVCRLRPGTDIRMEDGVPHLLVQEQDAPPWSPKSEAGERAIPLHAVLVEAGLLAWAEARAAAGEARIVPGTRMTGRAGSLGAEPSRQFSKLKMGLKVAPKTTFHSFRHSVSTILRNEDASLRETWIDAVLGHEGDGGRSLGITTYFKRVGVPNLVRVVAGICYPDAVEAAVRELVALGQPRQPGGEQ